MWIVIKKFPSQINALINSKTSLLQSIRFPKTRKILARTYITATAIRTRTKSRSNSTKNRIPKLLISFQRIIYQCTVRYSYNV